MDVLEFDVKTGRKTTLPVVARRALRALSNADVPFAVIGAVALGARGLPRNTRDIDVVVTTDDAFEAIAALRKAGFRSVTPIDEEEPAEAMYVLVHGKDEVDVLVTSGEPESTVIAEAPVTTVFGVKVPVATLEHLVLMYLYSNQPRHFADLARIVTETDAKIGEVERYLREVHPEMLAVLKERVHAARNPPPPPPRPKRRRG